MATNYTLVVYDPKRKLIQKVKIKENNQMKEGVRLTTLDMFTLAAARYGIDEGASLQGELDGKMRVIKYLNDSLKTSNPIIDKTISEESSICIRYNHDGFRYLEPVYESEHLESIANEFNQNLSVKPYTNKWKSLFFEDADNAEFLHATIGENKYLGVNHNKESFGSLLAELKDTEKSLEDGLEVSAKQNVIRKILNILDKDFFSRYKKLRGAVIFQEKYWKEDKLRKEYNGPGIWRKEMSISEKDVEVIKKMVPILSKIEEQKRDADKKRSDAVDKFTSLSEYGGKIVTLDHYDEEMINTDVNKAMDADFKKQEQKKTELFPTDNWLYNYYGADYITREEMEDEYTKKRK